MSNQMAPLLNRSLLQAVGAVPAVPDVGLQLKVAVLRLKAVEAPPEAVAELRRRFLRKSLPTAFT